MRTEPFSVTGAFPTNPHYTEPDGVEKPIVIPNPYSTDMYAFTTPDDIAPTGNVNLGIHIPSGSDRAMTLDPSERVWLVFGKSITAEVVIHF